VRNIKTWLSVRSYLKVWYGSDIFKTPLFIQLLSYEKFGIPNLIFRFSSLLHLYFFNIYGSVHRSMTLEK
jgi:hypothetical protein